MAKGEDIGTILVFAGLDNDALDECARLALRRTFARGRQIFSQGEPGVRFHSLTSGCVRVSQSGADGTQALLRFVGPGEPFGSFGIFLDGCYPAEATAIAESVELSWSETQFLALVDRYPRIAINLLMLAGRRLGELQDRLREMAGQAAEQRIATALLRLVAPKQGPGAGIDTAEIAWPVSRKDIAALSATTVYTASRVLARWQRDGLIASEGGRIRIPSRRDLASVVEHS